MSRARAVRAAVTAAVLLAVRVPASAVPVPPAAWAPATGLVLLLAVTAALVLGAAGGGRGPRT